MNRARLLGALLAVGLLLAFGPTVPAAGEEVDLLAATRDCTLIGCESGIFVPVRRIRRQLPKARSIELCSLGKCRRFRARTDFVSVRLRGVRGKRRVRVKLVVRNRGGKRIHRDRIRVRLHRTQPNGPDCPPVCFSCRLVLDADLELRKVRVAHS